jgi:hypothetical protein
MQDSFELPLSDIFDKPNIKSHLIRRLHSGENFVIVQDNGIEYELWAIESGKYKKKEKQMEKWILWMHLRWNTTLPTVQER